MFSEVKYGLFIADKRGRNGGNVKSLLKEQFYTRSRIGGREVAAAKISTAGVLITLIFTLIGMGLFIFVGKILIKGFFSLETPSLSWWGGLFFLCFVELFIGILMWGGIRSLFLQLNYIKYPTFIHDDGLEIQTDRRVIFIPYSTIKNIQVSGGLTIVTSGQKVRYHYKAHGIRELVLKLREQCPSVMVKEKFRKAKRELALD